VRTARRIWSAFSSSRTVPPAPGLDDHARLGQLDEPPEPVAALDEAATRKRHHARTPVESSRTTQKECGTGVGKSSTTDKL
jgi:hypothetical protein